jgi:hypothetical protein
LARAVVGSDKNKRGGTGVPSRFWTFRMPG